MGKAHLIEQGVCGPCLGFVEIALSVEGGGGEGHRLPGDFGVSQGEASYGVEHVGIAEGNNGTGEESPDFGGFGGEGFGGVYQVKGSVLVFDSYLATPFPEGIPCNVFLRELL